MTEKRKPKRTESDNPAERSRPLTPCQTLPLDANGNPTINPVVTRKGRLRPQHQDEVRAKIQSSVLVDRLQKHAQGLIDMTPTQIKAAEILLGKSLASLSSTELHVVNDRDKMSEAEILGKIAELVRRDNRLASLVGSGAVIEDAVVVEGGEEGDAVEDGPSDTSEDEPYDQPECLLCHGAGLPGGCMLCGEDSTSGDDAPPLDD